MFELKMLDICDTIVVLFRHLDIFVQDQKLLLLDQFYIQLACIALALSRHDLVVVKQGHIVEDRDYAVFIIFVGEGRFGVVHDEEAEVCFEANDTSACPRPEVENFSRALQASNCVDTERFCVGHQIVHSDCMQLSWNRHIEHILIVHHEVHLFEVIWVIEETRPISELSLLDSVKFPVLPRRLRNRTLVEV